ncbi:PAAR domain-containing protein [Cupriavidus sp. 30B13]|uniref:PAAR domain-containing protein n=1 Tax=Cupriavidus sp. 30B13 TaxID=3384241 RepID=UPI003B90C56F
MKEPALLDDPTSHGGKVKTASSTYVLDGRRAALVGDIVSCPIHGDNPLMEGGEGMTDEGRPLVVTGCRSQCGSIVLPGYSGVKIG